VCVDVRRNIYASTSLSRVRAHARFDFERERERERLHTQAQCVCHRFMCICAGTVQYVKVCTYYSALPCMLCSV
jgi:hypothetical protein